MTPAGTDAPVISRIVIAREPSLLAPFAGALGAAEDAALPAETIVVVAPEPGLAEAVRSRLPHAVVCSGAADLGTAVAWNLAATVARGTHLALVHEDTLVSPGWERGLVDLLASRPDAGVVGPRLVHADGSLQNRGWILCDNGWSVRIDDRTPDVIRSDVLSVDLVSSACAVLGRGHWERLGGFDERFFPAIGVDLDLGLATRAVGRRVLSTAAVTVTHATGAMVRPGRELVDGALRDHLIHRHTGRLRAKWSDELATCPRFPGDDPAAVAAAVRERVAALAAAPPVSGPHPAPDRSISAGAVPVDGRVPAEVDLRAALRRAEVLEGLLDDVLATGRPTGDAAAGPPAEHDVTPEELVVLRDRSRRLSAIERSRAWRLRTALAGRLPGRS